MRSLVLFTLFLVALTACKGPRAAMGEGGSAPFFWGNATVYFLLTDRFYNGDPSNDVHFDRNKPCGPLRNFMGGDIKGITHKIKEGYFDKLGVNAIWLTPVVEQVHGQIDEGSGGTYGFHGYWAKDWTAFDPNFGTEKDFAEMVEQAHRRGIRVVLDVVINHTGPANPKDPAWPSDWVRTGPRCVYKDYATTTACTLVDNLPDILTERDQPVSLPPALVEKWKKEGRYEREMAELDAFFARTGYPRAPRFYLIKWLTDMVRKYGVDGFRCDTAKHLEESVWAELRREADLAFADWKRRNPAKKISDDAFYMVGEVYGYNIAGGRLYDFGDRKVDYFNYGFTSLINFGLHYDAEKGYEAIFSDYDRQLHSTLVGVTALNYLSSHDDGAPFDPKREKPLESANKLLLCPGQAQVYYGDETSRSLVIPGAQGDATLRSFMNWDELAAGASRAGYRVPDVLAHWQKLGQFRRQHPAVGVGIHAMRSAQPYVFQRTLKTRDYADAVVIGLDLPTGRKELDVQGVFDDGMVLTDGYSGQKVTVAGGKARVDSPFSVVLLGR